MINDDRAASTAIRQAAHELPGHEHDYDRLLAAIGDARFVLIGEASHGTHEFYAERAALTRRLIAEQGFRAVAVEADWPDAYRVNCYVHGIGDAANSDQALGGFKRFPTWMWRNTVVQDFVEWLRAYNLAQPAERQAGFYGLDLYSLHSSVEAVIDYLDSVDPAAARQARQRYSCFSPFGQDSQSYGYAATAGIVEPCEDAVVEQLLELQRRASVAPDQHDATAADRHFYAVQNARLVKNAEEYYRTMFRGYVSSWNLRDQHMAETLEALVAHLDKLQPGTRVVIWAHNSHLGDARATQQGRGGELNLGQLVRQRFGDDAVLIGFSTYSGTVTAATDWGDPPERKKVRPALPESYEALLHSVDLPRFMLNLREEPLASLLARQRLERAIGVIYRPETERQSHYFYATLPEQFDIMIHLDSTTAVQPLERRQPWDRDEPPETFPSAL
jgi:erythromycin esterase-like protein